MTEVAFTFPGSPRSKERPRLGKGGNVYSPSAKLEGELGWYCRKYRRAFPRGISVCVDVEFFADTPGDIDNRLKLVLDAITKAEVWHDDAQVREIHVRVLPGGGDPRTEVVITALNGAAA